MAVNNYRDLTFNLRSRLDPENLIFETSINEELSGVSTADVIKYIRYAMNAVEDTYTQRSKEAGSRVKTHLIEGGISADFEYQGSVMTNTHIKGYSDIDLLVFTNKSYQYDAVNVHQILNESALQARYYPSSLTKLRTEAAVSKYLGDGLADLRDLRLRSERVLSQKYSICDTAKPKSIKINNTSLKREVDIVIANYYDDINSIINDKGNYRGVQVYNKDLHQRGKVDYPFLSIERINGRSSETGGRLKKMIRFLKNIKSKSDLSIDLSSFDINAICYDININLYHTKIFYDLVPVVFSQLYKLAQDSTFSDNLVSVDGREYIFRGNPQKLQALRNLLQEVQIITKDLQTTAILS